MPMPRAAQPLLQILLLLVAAGLGRAAGAHDLAGAGVAARSIGWSFDPLVLPLVLLSAVLYGVGGWRLWRRSRLARPVWHRRAAAFTLGCLMLGVALVSPLDSLGGALFSAHMVQHELLMLVVAPLLVLGHPLGVWLWALPAGARAACGQLLHRRWLQWLWGHLTRPLVAWVLHALALWAWHVPRLFEMALAHPGIHALQHTSFLASALLFWTTVLEPRTRQAPGTGGGIAMLSLFTTMAHTTALGALLTLAPGLWYPFYALPTAALGFDPLQDQQLGGLVMWVPGGVAYLVAGLVVAARWLQPDSRGATQAVPAKVSVP
jgi:putative membrane protein